jgi:hypothetical protein
MVVFAVIRPLLVVVCLLLLLISLFFEVDMHGFLFGGPTVDVQKNWRPIETAQRFSMAHPKSLQPTLAVTL